MPFHVARAAEKLVSVVLVDIFVTDMERAIVMPRDAPYFLPRTL